MLYVTTQSTHDAYTAHWAARHHRGPDGGFFVPLRMPTFESSKIRSLAEQSFSRNVADILNLFFGTKLTDWDVDVAVGGWTFSTECFGHRLMFGQLWTNAHESFDWVLRSLAERIVPELSLDTPLSNWLEIGIRIGVLFGVYGELLSKGQCSLGKEIDIAVATGDFFMPMALWYARQMGLPIGKIVCGCENSAVWDLLHRGEISAATSMATGIASETQSGLPNNIERLICGSLGQEQALRYWRCCMEGRAYRLSESDLCRLNKDVFVAVVSQERIASIIPSAYRTSGCILNPYGAQAYGALSDYRATSGNIGTTLVLVEQSPKCFSSCVAKAMNVTQEELNRILSERN